MNLLKNNKRWVNVNTDILMLVFVLLFFGGIWWINYPGTFDTDTVGQLLQVKKMSFTDTHPALNQIIWTILMKVWNNVAVITLSLVLLMTWLGYVLWKNYCYAGLKKWKKIILLTLFLLLPMSWLMVMVPWKDAFFSIILVLETVYLIYWLKNNQPPKVLYFLAIMVGFNSVLRHNGLILLLFFPISLRLLGCKLWSVIDFTLLMLFVRLVLVGPVYKLYSVDSSTSIYQKFNAVAVSDAAAVLNNHGVVSAGQINDLEMFLLKSSWIKYYSCHDFNQLIWHSGLVNNIKNLNESEIKKVNETIGKIIRNNIPIVMGHKMCLWVNSLGFGLRNKSYLPDGSLSTLNDYALVDKALINIPQDKNIALKRLLHNIINLSVNNTFLKWLWWTPLTFLTIITIYLWKGRQKLGKNIWVLLPILSITFGYFLASTDSLYRYNYHLYLALFVLPLLGNNFLVKKKKK